MRVFILTICTIILLNFGCSSTAKPADVIQQAYRYLEKGDYDSYRKLLSQKGRQRLSKLFKEKSGEPFTLEEEHKRLVDDRGILDFKFDQEITKDGIANVKFRYIVRAGESPREIELELEDGIWKISRHELIFWHDQP